MLTMSTNERNERKELGSQVLVDTLNAIPNYAQIRGLSWFSVYKEIKQSHKKVFKRLWSGERVGKRGVREGLSYKVEIKPRTTCYLERHSKPTRGVDSRNIILATWRNLFLNENLEWKPKRK